MGRINYYGLEVEIKDILEQDAAISGVHVLIESGLNTFEGLTIMIFLDSRVAPEESQSMAAGTRTRFLLTFTILCIAPDYESLAAASHSRDDLIGKVEVALMKNRTLNDQVRSSWLEGGLFDNARDADQASFISIGEVRLIVDVTSSTD